MINFKIWVVTKCKKNYQFIFFMFFLNFFSKMFYTDINKLWVKFRKLDICLFLIKRIYLSQFRAIWRWNSPANHVNVKFLKYKTAKKNFKKALFDYSTCNTHSKISPGTVTRKVKYLTINCFCNMIDQEIHYYEKQGDWN